MFLLPDNTVSINIYIIIENTYSLDATHYQIIILSVFIDFCTVESVSSCLLLFCVKCGTVSQRSHILFLATHGCDERER